MFVQTRGIGLALIALALLSPRLPEAHAPRPAPARVTPVVQSPEPRRTKSSPWSPENRPAPKLLFLPVEGPPSARLILTEDLILGLAEGRSLTELRVPILSLYPELAAALDETPGLPRKNAIRRSADLYRIRQELTAVVLADYAAATRDLP